ncbi:hypothetical protein KEJ32_01770 [Candidatus Bathyarchaeota archaeon]|nr:hypothetical protein [Candidatus Bathyarchaeota archaeon]MBS7636445.1 hypothetical protein [Candidatus Bathyarchaeota archaeon]
MVKTEAISAFLIAIGLLLIIHHTIFRQRPFDLADMLHHEFFEAIFFTAGITLLIMAWSNKRRGRQN